MDDALEELEVCSAHGVELPWVVLGLREGDELEAWPDAEGRVALPPDGEVDWIAAPGHRRSWRTDRRERSVVLDSECTLTLRFDGPRPASFDFDDPVADGWREALSATWCAGFMGPREWTLVVDPLAFRRLLPWEMTFAFPLQGPFTLHVEFHPESGRHVLREVRVPRLHPERSPLRVRVVDAAAGSPVLFHLWPRRAARRLLDQGPWGSIRLWHDRAPSERRIGPDGGAAFDEVFLGWSYGLAAVEDTTGAHARTFFEHDGSDCELHLEPGFVLVGEIAAAREPWPLVDPTLRWELGALDPDGEFSGSPGWSREALDRDPAVDRDFRVPVVSGRVPRSEHVEWPQPRTVRVTVDASGYHPAERVLPTPTGGELDCGTIRLEPISAGIELAVGHGLDPDDVLHFRPTSSGPAHDGAVVEEAWRDADGRLCLALDEPRFSAPPATPGASTQRLLVRFGSGACRPFTLGADGAYEAEPVARHEVDVAISADNLPPGRLSLGWSWHGLRAPLLQQDRDLLEPTPRFRFDAPPAGVAFWWELDGDEPLADSVPLTPGRTRWAVP